MKRNESFNKTLCMITETCTEWINDGENAPEDIWIKLFDLRQERSFTGMYDYYIKWAKDFEKIHKGREWKGDKYKELEPFVKNKIENI